MEIEKLTVEELKNGYRYNKDTDSYICNTCRKAFEVGEIYSFGDRLFEAFRGVKIHVESDHGDNLKQLLYGESKYNTLTDNHKELMSLMYSNVSDKDIAKTLGISPSTVRHQRFMFREKAKQAKMYLAIYEQVMEMKSTTDEMIVPVHSTATMVDERYIITEKEKEKILTTEFESLSPLKLKRFPGKEKRKVVILTKIAEQLEHGKRYTEKELNQIIAEIYEDYALIRRYLIEYGFMDRTIDGKAYWMK
ncbi:conserved hypothetical protein [Alkaliphilus metalliredigens QYMF]|uniref:DUF2087 domain-containing protein n=1 Tax=Alkaliphilus metalliredigens (strain QYMF) TaxID=293826 RepID=A6TPE1_ALKMQ|nr:DUF2087 domain-containing protein [Alkaliphilus metalliredigens]ABR48059.1 conserved hypothetical protein [Alkaliphilus metalliredigens QYMF]